MATLAEPQLETGQAGAREERFFLTMALVMAGVIVAGFALNLAVGRSTFASPLLFHIHAFFFFGWLAIYVTQNALVATNNVAIHRRLGWIAVLWVPAMIVLGLMMTVHSIQAHGGPPFFDVSEFLIGNPLGLLYFAVMVATAVTLRRRTDWHRRFMYSGMAALTGPGVGRLLPMPLFIPWGWWIASFGAAALFIVIGMIADKRRAGRVHRAWWWTLGALVVMQVATDAIAYSPLGTSITHAVIDGTPGAARDWKAHMP